MGFLDAVKGLFQSEVVQGAIESTGLADLGEQVGTQLEDLTAGVEGVGADVGQLADTLPGAAELPLDPGTAIEGLGQHLPGSP